MLPAQTAKGSLSIKDNNAKDKLEKKLRKLSEALY